MIGNLACIPYLLTRIEIDKRLPVNAFVKVIGNIISASNEEIVNKMLEYGVLNTIFFLSSHVQEYKLNEIAWTLSNITAGSTAQIQAFLLHKKLVELVLTWAREASSRQLKIESTYVFVNAI